MDGSFFCAKCGKDSDRASRSGTRQTYCGKKACQRARKAKWKKHKMASDSDYVANQKRCYQKWQEANPGYWQHYRQTNPDKAKTNRVLQQVRNHVRKQRHSGASEVIAKVDALIPRKHSEFSTVGEYHLIPLIAKVDALNVKNRCMCARLRVIAKVDSIAVFFDLTYKRPRPNEPQQEVRNL
jgi:hypothetical protein